MNSPHKSLCFGCSHREFHLPTQKRLRKLAIFHSFPENTHNRFQMRKWQIHVDSPHKSLFFGCSHRKFQIPTQKIFRKLAIFHSFQESIIHNKISSAQVTYSREFAWRFLENILNRFEEYFVVLSCRYALIRFSQRTL